MNTDSKVLALIKKIKKFTYTLKQKHKLLASKYLTYSKSAI
jgi:hypothetical protein